MKTKISHLGRSTVSVILAVMMLLSTMLIGTVSTVNAVTKTFEAVNLVGNINGNTNGIQLSILLLLMKQQVIGI